MVIDPPAVLVKAMQYSIITLFGSFVLGAWLLALFRYRLRERTVGNVRKLGWLALGLAFSLLGTGMLLMVVHQTSLGEAHVMTVGGRLDLVASASPLFFVLAVAFELFTTGLFFAIGYGYMRLGAIPRDQ